MTIGELRKKRPYIRIVHQGVGMQCRVWAILDDYVSVAAHKAADGSVWWSSEGAACNALDVELDYLRSALEEG